MKSYELTYIISSQIGSDQIDGVIKDIESFIKSREGVILKSEKTTAQVFAYPIKKQSSGYFIISEFQMLEPTSNASRSDAGWDKIKEVKEILQKEKNILRHFLIVKKPLKVMKERRTRKPLSMTESTLKEKSGSSEILSDQDKKKGEKVELEEIEKKLDEILSE